MDALAAPALFFILNLFQPKPNELTEPQKEMISMLHAMAPIKEGAVIQLNARWEVYHLIEVCMDVAPGGFLLIPGDYTFLKPYFLEHGWQVMPFMFEDKYIFRKPMRQSA